MEDKSKLYFEQERCAQYYQGKHLFSNLFIQFVSIVTSFMKINEFVNFEQK